MYQWCMITLGLGLLYISTAEHILSPASHGQVLATAVRANSARCWRLKSCHRRPVDQAVLTWIHLNSLDYYEWDAADAFFWEILGYMLHPFHKVQARFLENITSFKPWIALPQVIQETFRSTRVTIELMLGSRWPVLAALASIRSCGQCGLAGSATFSSASLCMARISDNSTNLYTNYIE